MAYQGFGKESGPSLPLKSQIPIGHFPRPPPPSPPSPPPPRIISDYAPPRSSWEPAAQERMQSPLLALGSTHPASLPYPSARVDGQKSFLKDYDSQTNQMPSVVTSFVASRNSGTSVEAKIARFQDLKRNNSPPFLSTEENILRNSNQTIIRSRPNVLVNQQSHLVPQRTRSPPLAFEHNHSIDDYRPPPGQAQMPAMGSSAWGEHSMLAGNYANLSAHQNRSSVTPYLGSYNSKSSPTEPAYVLAPKQTTQPSPSPFPDDIPQENIRFAQSDSKRSSLSPSKNMKSNIIFDAPYYHTQQRSMPSAQNTDAEAAVTTSTSFPVSKRTRSPPLTYDDEILQGNSYLSQDSTEREMQAKAKRLARFRVELSENVQSSSDIMDQKISANRHDRSMMERGKFIKEHSMEAAGDFLNGNVSTDYEGMESSSIIIGLCPDMCPESERGERERKGDLDQYERLDGDRNQTSKSLAVKKYNRTAEREANLIRPMPVLQKTIDYLLNLLNQPYDNRLLGLYNFLWDRMRAIRMDLRMQHIFTHGAITMLEQMIRLHIIAMHELCEYTKGEGFSEGFDAHLNIEQMNKTSVDLFQMYDDHRKKDINVPTEKEFRGYYALLKLDKHPGYKVEPAELSLDLAKMTPEIRQAPEVLFARDVARACRTGNFVSFFRLARKASYLQACLMHAHFAKLRSQALASLHCGLQNNQGLPVAHVAKWLGMEEEDIESLLEYHGFSVKEFEQPYMVKEGPFLNGGKDYPTRCSKLVHLKKSERIVEDILSSFQAVSLPAKEVKGIQLGEISKHEPKIVQPVERKISIHAIDEEMPNFNAASSPKDVNQMQPMLKTSTGNERSEEEHQAFGVNISPWNFSLAQSSLVSWPAKINALGKPSYDIPFGNSSETNLHSGIEGTGSQVNYAVEDSVPTSAVVSDLEDEEPRDDHQANKVDEAMANDQDDDQDEEAAEAKLKLILRLWKRRASKQRELREQRHLAASAALNLLSLGPPIRQNKHQPSSFGEFDIDQVMKERHEKLKKSWSRLNVSDVVGNILSQRNPNTKCLCWKIIVRFPMENPKGDKLGQSHHVVHSAAGSWLLAKLMPSRKDDDDIDNDDLVTLSGLSIWKKWIPTESDTGLACCLSVIKDTEFDDLNDTICGASAVLFLVCESIPWEHQKIRLHNLLMSLPSGSCLPLLILSDSYNEAVSDPSSTIVNKLGLYNIDRSRISNLLVISLVESRQLEHSDGFYSDEQLREGLQWLASETPIQPVLHCVKTRELVQSHLNYLLEVLDKMSDYQVGPDHCISAFNEALDQSVEKIAAAANANPNGWPCPELSLLKEFSNENSVMNRYLPSIGWSLTAKIDPVMCALRDCKLLVFQDDISWLNIGSVEGEEIENKRLKLESCLVRYLNQSSNMMGYTLATKEANVMLQKSARLELHNSNYYIVPKWIMIFRRIFNWRLMSLSSGEFSVSYVLEQHGVYPSPSGLDRLGLEERSVSSPYFLNYPSLDEMVEVGCNSLLSERDHSQQEGFQPLADMVRNGAGQEVANASNLMADETGFVQDGESAVTDNVVYLSGGLVVAAKATEGEDGLSKLLEQCNIMQNRIGEKLSIYF